MKICLAATASMYPENKPLITEIPYVLESFCYIRDFQLPLIKTANLFLLDSGAFTFLSNAKSKVDWNDYVTRYIDFINQYDAANFFELDIDAIVGYEKVKEIRKRIETETGKKTIPVWHKSRGIEEFKRLVSEYDYIAIGGFAIKDIKREEYPKIKSLVRYASEHKVKVHGLGFTPKDVTDYAFYSCDSSSWATCKRYGKVYKFADGNIKIVNPAGMGTKRDMQPQIERITLKEWIKYQKFMSKDD